MPASSSAVCDEVPIALVSDPLMWVGIHVAALSTLEQWRSPALPHFYLVHDGLSDGELQSLEATLRATGKPFRLDAVHFDAARLAGLGALQGNLATHGRALLGELLPDVPYAVYLDADVLVNLCVGELAASVPELECFPLAAVPSSDFGHVLEADFWHALEVDLDAPYFNAGVLVLNLETWRREGLLQRYLDFGRRYRTTNQPILNYLAYRNFLPLDGRYNRTIYPSTPQMATPLEEGIWHFVGSPKPFDPLGAFLNQNAGVVLEAVRRTAWREEGSLFGQAERLKRLVYLRRSYLREVLHRAGLRPPAALPRKLSEPYRRSMPSVLAATSLFTALDPLDLI